MALNRALLFLCCSSREVHLCRPYAAETFPDRLMMRPIQPLLATLALGTLLSSTASADLLVSGIWGGTFTGLGATALTIEFDTETNRVDFFGNYRNLQSEMTDLVVEYSDGSEVLFTLHHDGGSQGAISGSATLDPEEADAILAGDLQVRMSNVDPNMGGGVRVIHFGESVHQQASAQHPTISGAFSTATGFTNPTGLQFNASAQGFADEVTRVELFRGAWYGETGVSVGEAMRFAAGEWWSLHVSDLTPDLLGEWRDGLTYVEIETTAGPDQLIRMQLTDGLVGTEHCQFNTLDPNLQISGSQLSIQGSPRIVDGPLQLHGRWLPPNTFVIPLVARSNRQRAMIPFTSSVMCLGGGPVGRLASGVGMTNGAGVFQAALDPLAMPTPNGPVAALPGEQWNVQLWYRDVQNGGLVQSNFSSAVRLELR